MNITGNFLLLICVLFLGCQKKEPPPPPPTVEVTNVIQKDVPITGEWVTTLDGYIDAQIQPQITGYLIKQDYKEGSFVHKGQVLFEIDPRPFQATLDGAKAQLAQGQAQLVKTDLDVHRDIPLAKMQAIAQSQLDNDTQANLAAKAAVEAAQAQVEQAQLNLNYTKVKSLIDGIAGIAQVQIGNLAQPTTLLTTVSQLDPIKAYVPVTEEDYFSFGNDLSRLGKAQLVLDNGMTYPQKGSFIFVDRQVNSQTGTILVAVTFPNPKNLLRPGQFGNVRAVVGVRKKALLVPQQAVIELQGTYRIAVVGNDNKVNVHPIEVGDTFGNMWIIKKGVNPDERVVVEGTQTAKNGMKVNPKPYNPAEENNKGNQNQSNQSQGNQ